MLANINSVEIDKAVNDAVAFELDREAFVKAACSAASSASGGANVMVWYRGQDAEWNFGGNFVSAWAVVLGRWGLGKRRGGAAA